MDAINSLFPVDIASANNSLYSANNANSSSLLLGASAAIIQTKYNWSLVFGRFWIWSFCLVFRLHLLPSFSDNFSFLLFRIRGDNSSRFLPTSSNCWGHCCRELDFLALHHRSFQPLILEKISLHASSQLLILKKTSLCSSYPNFDLIFNDFFSEIASPFFFLPNILNATCELCCFV